MASATATAPDESNSNSNSNSNSVNNLASALAAFQAQHSATGKDKKNTHLNYDYASLSATNKAIQPAAAQGICHWFTLHPVALDGMLCRLTVTHAPSGESISSEYPINTAGDEKKTGASITYAKKYLLWGAYGLANEHDEDLDKPDEKEKGGKGDSSESQQRGQSAPTRQRNSRPARVAPKQQQRPVRTAAVKREPENAYGPAPAQATEPVPAQATEASRQFDESKSLLEQRFEPLTDDQAFAALDAFRDHFKLGVTSADGKNVKTLEHAQWLHSYLDNLLKSPDALPF